MASHTVVVVLLPLHYQLMWVLEANRLALLLATMVWLWWLAAMVNGIAVCHHHLHHRPPPLVKGHQAQHHHHHQHNQQLAGRASLLLGWQLQVLVASWVWRAMLEWQWTLEEASSCRWWTLLGLGQLQVLVKAWEWQTML